MKKSNIFFSLVGLFIMSIFSACSNFEDLNTNPDATMVVSPAMLCTKVVLDITRYNGRDAKAYISENALPKYVGYATESQMSTQYNQIGNASFGSMTVLPNIDKMLEAAKGSTLENSYKGVAKFVRAYSFFKLTMQMGDIPYSHANQGMSGNYKPKYDRQEDVFIAILNELKEADQLFALGDRFTGDPTPFNGDVLKWRKATNSLALKILMSLSKKANVVSLDLKRRFSEIVEANILLDNTTTTFFGLTYSIQNKHPLSGTSDMFTKNTILSSLLLDSLKTYNDRRLFYYAEASAFKLTAAGGGLIKTNINAYVGVDVAMDFAAMSAEHAAKKYSLLNKRYLIEVASDPRILLSYAEQQLILAEARILEWISTGTAKTFYEDGVKSALATIMATPKATTYAARQIDQIYINGYFIGNAAFKINKTDQLKQVWLQRYFLNFMQDADMSYFEYRRTNFPDFPINPETNLNQNNKNAIPIRWMYPTSETDFNRDNLIIALNDQYEGYDEVNKLMWLLK
ncbi:MAG: SusD/RagB family nutrient-binding outer membrane lipoprotein [Paludibacter sp.]|nr:SusD/RagB family nutrient-binding outer membrane lipoprotein [Paludibacter sp.]